MATQVCLENGEAGAQVVETVASDAPKAPLFDATESDVNRLVDDVLRSGQHLTLPVPSDAPEPERYHAKAIAEQMQRLAQQLSGDAPPNIGEDRDEWWFELGGKRLGP